MRELFPSQEKFAPCNGRNHNFKHGVDSRYPDAYWFCRCGVMRDRFGAEVKKNNALR